MTRQEEIEFNKGMEAIYKEIDQQQYEAGYLDAKVDSAEEILALKIQSNEDIAEAFEAQIEYGKYRFSEGVFWGSFATIVLALIAIAVQNSI